MTQTSASLLTSAGLVPGGPITWGGRIPVTGTGVYVVETHERLQRAPIDASLVRAWMRPVATLLLDGTVASVVSVVQRLDRFWLPGESVVYIGLAGTAVAKRVGQFYRTPLGDPKPHAGGHWLKTLGTLETCHVWYAATDEPGRMGDALRDGPTSGASAVPSRITNAGCHRPAYTVDEGDSEDHPTRAGHSLHERSATYRAVHDGPFVAFGRRARPLGWRLVREVFLARSISQVAGLRTEAGGPQPGD